MNKTLPASIPQEFSVFIQPLVALGKSRFSGISRSIECGTPNSELARYSPSPPAQRDQHDGPTSETRRLAIAQQVNPFIGTTGSFAEKCHHDGEPDRTNDDASSTERDVGCLAMRHETPQKREAGDDHSHGDQEEYIVLCRPQGKPHDRDDEKLVPRRPSNPGRKFGTGRKSNTVTPSAKLRARITNQGLVFGFFIQVALRDPS